jgi:hypothetical protein
LLDCIYIKIKLFYNYPHENNMELICYDEGQKGNIKPLF